MVRSFACKQTEKIWCGLRVKSLPPEIQNRALLQLRLIDAAAVLEDLRVPPGNRLEALHGDRAGQHSIRINKQWRICFIWKDGDAHNVEILDYH